MKQILSRIGVSVSYLLKLMVRMIVLPFERLRYAFVRPAEKYRFCVVSCQRNSGKAAEKCLNSVYKQKYPGGQVRHIYIDDASDDRTTNVVEDWMESHPDNTVEFIRRKERVGGTENTARGFDLAKEGEIIVELNGDDWLPDSGVLGYLNRIYNSGDVWMTYNSCKVSGTHRYLSPLGYSRRTVRKRLWRQDDFECRHLRTFRSGLWNHFDKQRLIDPKTGEYWENGDDVAIYISLLEMSGDHTRRVLRKTCVYNFHENTEHKKDRSGQVARSQRMRQMPALDALDFL